MEKLTREFYTRDSLTVARELLGKVLVHRLDGETLARRTGRPTPTAGGAPPEPR